MQENVAYGVPECIPDGKQQLSPQRMQENTTNRMPERIPDAGKA